MHAPCGYPWYLTYLTLGDGYTKTTGSDVPGGNIVITLPCHKHPIGLH